MILGERDPRKSLRNHYQVENETQIIENQNVIENFGKLELKNYPKRKPPVVQHQQLKIQPPNCPFCERINWLEFDKCYFCKNCEDMSKKQKHQIDNKIRRSDQYFCTRLPYANKKNKDKFYPMVNTTYISTEDMNYN